MTSRPGERADVDTFLPPVTDTEGAVTIETVWPTVVPVGTQVWLQAWIADGGAVAGYAASRGLQVTAP